MTKKGQGKADLKDEIEFLKAERAEKARLRRLESDHERSRGPLVMYVSVLCTCVCSRTTTFCYPRISESNSIHRKIRDKLLTVNGLAMMLRARRATASFFFPRHI